jgi:hypothetical protein
MNLDQQPQAHSPGLRPGWSRPRPEKLPAPTAWPVALALAVTLIVWGLVSSLILTAFGGALFIASMAGWVADIRHERKSE